MPSSFEPGGGDARQIVNPLMAPGVALALCNPFLAAALAGNAHAFGEFGAIANEWQDFMRRRFKEDVALLHRLRESGKADEILAAYADFWRKAGEDYGGEVATMTKLATELTSKLAVASPSASEEENSRAH